MRTNSLSPQHESEEELLAAYAADLTGAGLGCGSETLRPARAFFRIVGAPEAWANLTIEAQRAVHQHVAAGLLALAQQLQQCHLVLSHRGAPLQVVCQLPGKHTVASFVKPPDLHHLRRLYLTVSGAGVRYGAVAQPYLGARGVDGSAT